MAAVPASAAPFAIAWGIVDVDDCINGVNFLVAEGLVDHNRIVIRGGSAGGYTTLAALVFRDFFHSGASYYGVSDVAALARETHKFESRYLDWLIGPYPQAQERYRERSPLYHVDQLSRPVIFFQGTEDAIVPPYV
jgi:dipeptidyl aminopeptidase/acylaminoacyl peptidase